MTSTSDAPAQVPAARPTWRERARPLLPAAALLLVFVGVSIAVIPSVSSNSSPAVTVFDLDQSQSTPSLRLRAAARNIYGIVVDGSNRGNAAFALPAPPAEFDRTVLFVSAGGGPGVDTTVSLIDGAGIRHVLGSPNRWRDHRLDVTSLIDRSSRLEFSALNGTATPALIGDRVRVASYRSGELPTASRWVVTAWVALATLLGLVVLRRARSHAPVVAGAALAAWLAWPKVTEGALQPQTNDLWDAAVHAEWFDLDHGLLSGTFGSLPHLAVQLFHALTPIVGDGAPAARGASMLVGVAALVAIYVLARRVAGTVGAIAASLLALIADPFRLSLTDGGATGTLILAACLFLLAVHRALQRVDRKTMVALGVTGALAILAEPLWWPGVVAGLVLLALWRSPPGVARASLGVGLTALALVSLPSRVSVAHQSRGDSSADVVERATRARNVEFVGHGHGAPANAAELGADPAGGSQVGLGDYMLGDHSLSVVVGSMLSGAYDSLHAAGRRSETKLVGLVAFLVGLAGAVFLLLLPRLRVLVVVAALVALVPWFFTARTGAESFLAVTPFWPILPLGAAVIAYALAGELRRRFGTPRVVEEAQVRLSAMSRRLGRRTQPAKP